MRQKIIPIASVVIGILAFLLTDRFLTRERNKLELDRQRFIEETRQIYVVAAARDIPSGWRLAPGDLGKRLVPKMNVGERAVMPDRVQMLYGRKVLFNVKAKDPILWSDVEGGGLGGIGLAPMVKPGLRAISLNIGGAQSVSGMVEPNDRVDVLGTFLFPSKTVAGEMEAVTLTVLQNVTVLATGQKLAKDSLGPGARRGSGGYSTVTLEVTPSEAELLVFAEQSKGRLSLSLRNPSDVGFEAQLPSVNFDHLQTELPNLNNERQKRLGGRPIN
jgi:pilus assembly protein CpaB